MKKRLASALVSFALALAPLGASAQPIVVTVAPPPRRTEVVSPQPSPAHVWVAGNWAWNGTQPTWTPGRWEVPPHAGHQWREARWERHGGGFQYTPGVWAAPPPVVLPPGAVPSAVLVPPQLPPVGAVPEPVMVAPPPLRREVRPATGPTGQVWVPGYWQWNGIAHSWVAGHFEAPPQLHRNWRVPRWERRGRGWMLTPGRWQ